MKDLQKTQNTNSSMDSKQFIKKLESLSSSKIDKFEDVGMGQIFKLAKEFIQMEISEIEKLLESPIHKVRVGAVSIMDFQARSKKFSEEYKKELFDLYIRRHDRINTWDLVDRSAIYVVGSYLANKPHDILYKLAHSKAMWERRTSIVSTAAFIRQNQLDDTFKIAEILLKDDEDLIHKATGWMLRFAGDKDMKRLKDFLDKHASTMPRAMLRYSIEKLAKKQREHHLGLKKDNLK
jgi:3-methyladenine DNA glycosylase AlkD